MGILREHTETVLASAAEARTGLEISEIHFLGARGVADPGRHLANYANMIANRIITLYDDCSLMLANRRIPSACVLARCILETYAVGDFAIFEVAKAFNSGGLEKAGTTVMAYVNSSRLKAEEQKRLKEGKFVAADYHFTPAALDRMTNEEAAAKHILNALRHLFRREMEITSRQESNFELLYERLSEWTHPSQTSLFYAFAKDTWSVETSAGTTSIWDGALESCGSGMHFITAVPDLKERMDEVADQLSAAFETAT